VREALRLLGHTGLVEIRARRGAIVAELTAARVDEMFVAMSEIEATCARLCALAMSPIDRARLEALHERMGLMVKKRNEAAYAEANTAFHSAIYAGTYNMLLIDIATALRRRLSPFRRAQFRAPGRLARSHSEHASVVAAILRGEPAEAHAAMLRHVNLAEHAYEQVSAAGAQRAKR
jgi:DNA-binding GntR family transcriptional regulator